MNVPLLNTISSIQQYASPFIAKGLKPILYIAFAAIELVAVIYASVRLIKYAFSRYSTYAPIMAPAQKLTNDILLNVIGKNLSLRDFVALARVCKNWHEWIQPNIGDKLLGEVTFGKDKWLSIPGIEDVGEEVPLTDAQKKALITKLKAPCQFFNEADPIQPHRFEDDKIKRVYQTRILLTIPATINGLSHNPDTFGRLMRFQKEGDAETMYEYIPGKKGEGFRGRSPQRSYRILFTLDVVPGSRGKTSAEQKRLLESGGNGIRMPTILEAITAIGIMNLSPSKDEKGYFFGRKGEWYTFTKVGPDEEDHFRIVGAAGPPGLHVDYLGLDFRDVGVAGVEEVL